MSKKIVYIIPRFTTGGAEKLVLEYSKFFQKLKYEITVISIVGCGELEQEFEKNNINTVVFEKKNIFNFYKNIKKIKELIQDINPDIIHSHIFSADLVAYFIKKSFGQIKWISTQHNVECNASFIRKKIWKKILKKSDLVIAVAKKVYDFDKKYFKLNKNLIEIKNGVSLDKWFTSENNIFQNKTINFAIIGRLEKQKAHKYLFQVLKKIKNNNWLLHVFGVGNEEEKLKNLAKKYNLEENIIWHGVSFNLKKDVENIDVVLQPSLWEGLSLVIMEMMLAAKLILASEIAGEELIQNKKTGLLFKTGNFCELKDKINYILENEDKLIYLAKAGQKFALENFSLENNLERIKEIYEK
jgi:glycosyltransferase involved in cell wall biosynthesis